MIVGNTVLYGATAGSAFFAGRAGERFAVRNSGASAVVEGVGDHGCEYMTGGRVVVLGATGRNFAAGMSGGIAYVLDADGSFAARCNFDLVELEALEQEDVDTVRELVEAHLRFTGSKLAGVVLDHWELHLPQFVKVMPRDYKRALGRARRGHGVERRRRLSHDRVGGARLMGKLRGFLEYDRAETIERDPAERVGDYREFVRPLPLLELRAQGARCMECGVPFCHSGCPLGNLIPDWNDLVYRDNFAEAIAQLHRTNNFPEFTGPALSRAVRGGVRARDRRGQRRDDQADRGGDREPRVGGRLDRPGAAAHANGAHGCRDRLRPGGARRGAAAEPRRPPGDGVRARRGGRRARPLRRSRTSRSRSGSSSGACSSSSTRACVFRYGVDVGGDVDAEELRAQFDAVVVATGARVPRDLPVPGRELDGVHFAMDYLYQRNRFVAGRRAPERAISAAGKHVVVIGGGDTGADCVGNAHREGAASRDADRAARRAARRAAGRRDAVAASGR